MADTSEGMPERAGAVTATALLYQTDSYLKRFEARILAAEGNALALDCTAFFPGGGGQMADRGALVVDGRRLTVAGLRKQDDVVWHEIDSASLASGALPAVGHAVQGELDWPFRYRMMRTHTAVHTLTAIIFRNYGAQVTGGQMYPDRARMDFAMETFSAELARDIAADVNQALAEDHPVKVYFLPRERALAIPDLIRTKINLLPPQISTIRIIEIVGVDMQADGGTHVRNSREVGAIRVLKTENKGRINKRMEVALVDEP
jgi:misacylated tRNA(Ala) deacylase